MLRYGGKLALLLLILNLVVVLAGVGLERYGQSRHFLPGYNADKINLLRLPERAGSAKPDDAEPEASAIGGPVAVPGGDGAAASANCLRLPDYDQAAHDRLTADLEAVDLKPGKYDIRLDKRLGWWVYIPPERDDIKREAVIAQLKAAGVQDMAVIGRGSMTNAISLGMFADSAQALAQLAALRAKGVRSAVQGPRPDAGPAQVDLSGLSQEARGRLPARLQEALAACSG